MVTRVTSKGQVTIPRDIRARMRIHVGDAVEFVVADGTVTLRKVVDFEAMERWLGHLEELCGQDSDQIVEDLRGD